MHPVLRQTNPTITSNSVGVSVKTLDLAAGSYNTAYTIPFSETSPYPPLTRFNAADIHPDDERAYGNIQVDSKEYLVRFGVN